MGLAAVVILKTLVYFTPINDCKIRIGRPAGAGPLALLPASSGRRSGRQSVFLQKLPRSLPWFSLCHINVCKTKTFAFLQTFAQTYTKTFLQVVLSKPLQLLIPQAFCYYCLIMHKYLYLYLLKRYYML